MIADVIYKPRKRDRCRIIPNSKVFARKLKKSELKQTTFPNIRGGHMSIHINRQRENHITMVNVHAMSCTPQLLESRLKMFSATPVQFTYNRLHMYLATVRGLAEVPRMSMYRHPHRKIPTVPVVHIFNAGLTALHEDLLDSSPRDFICIVCIRKYRHETNRYLCTNK